MKVDRILNVKDNSPALLFQGTLLTSTVLFLFYSTDVKFISFSSKLLKLCADDGGGMDPDGIRKCMSLGYSSKKSNTTIGQCECFDLLCFDWLSCFHNSFTIMSCVSFSWKWEIHFWILYVKEKRIRWNYHSGCRSNTDCILHCGEDLLLLSAVSCWLSDAVFICYLIPVSGILWFPAIMYSLGVSLKLLWSDFGSN